MRKLIPMVLAIILLFHYIPSKGMTSAISICSDHSGNIFVLNTATQQVHKFDSTYNYQATVIGGNQISGMTNLTVCWCAGEAAFVSSASGASKLFEYETKTTYKYMRPVTQTGNGVGQLKNPVDICYLRSDYDYWLSVVDRSLKKVVVIDDLGKISKEVTGLVDPTASYYSTTKKLYILDDDQVKTASNTDKKTTASFGRGLLSNPKAIDASEYEDKIFVLDGNAVKSFTTSGVMIKQFATVPEAATLTVNIGASEVVVGSNSDGGSLYVFSYDGNLKRTVKNIASPKKQVVLKFTVGGYTYEVNGEKFKLSCPVRIENGRSLVPVRQVVEPLGGKIAWDAAKQKITISYSSPRTVTLTIGDPYAYVDGKKTLLPSAVPPRIYCNGTTMVPLKFVSDILGAGANYYSDTKLIEVKK